MEVIARVSTPFPEKFGVPRQSGLVESAEGLVVFEPAFRVPQALRGLEGFSHVWLIWGFSQAERTGWSPTVRPPRLGGETRVGVFASRSPFRPNALGLSSLKLLGMEEKEGLGLCLRVAGVDMVDGSPVYDIKPYLPYADCHPQARGGFANEGAPSLLQVAFPAELMEQIPLPHRAALKDVLAQDPRPAYQDDPTRRYGLAFAGHNVHFRVSGGLLTVTGVERL